MDVFKALWRPRGNISIPTYKQGEDEDGADLQVKSLFYMFRRLRIAHSTYQSGQPLADLSQKIPGISEEDLANLDKMYNLEGFEHALLHDSHRVLVDWVKNRFRSFLLLSHMPQMDFPRFPDPNYRFIVLAPDASNDEYIKTLSESDIYREHPLTVQVRQSIAESAVRKHPNRDLNARAAIIQDFLWNLGIEIQVARLYKASLKASPALSPATSPVVSPSASPTNSRPSSPVRLKVGNAAPPALSPTRGRAPAAPLSPSQRLRTPSPSKSPTRIRLPAQQSTSPTAPPSPPPKLRVRQSLSNLKLTPKLSKPDLKADSKALDAASRHQVLNHARQAVLARLDKEKSIILLECARV